MDKYYHPSSFDDKEAIPSKYPDIVELVVIILTGHHSNGITCLLYVLLLAKKAGDPDFLLSNDDHVIKLQNFLQQSLPKFPGGSSGPS